MPYKNPEKQRAAQLEYYHRNAEKVQNAADQRRRQMRERVAAIKGSTPCADCGGKFPAVCMDFDHIGPDKMDDISSLISRRASWSRIDAEIQKCELVCANCHRIRTQSRL